MLASGNSSGLPLALAPKKYTPAFKTGCVAALPQRPHRRALCLAHPAASPQRPRTTVADPAASVAENLLLGQPSSTAPNRVWDGDPTYLPLVGGRWYHLATWPDTYARRVVGWQLDQRLPTEVATSSLEQVPTLHQSALNVIINFDCGSQYTRSARRTHIAQAHALAGFSPQGSPQDKAQVEAGCSTLKTELLPHGGAFTSLEEARLGWPTTSTLTSTSTDGTPRHSIAQRTNLNGFFKSTYLLSSLSVFTGPLQFRGCHSHIRPTCVLATPTLLLS